MNRFFWRGRLAAVVEGNSIQQNDSSLVAWASRISLDQIPGLLLVLASRWLVETTAKASEQDTKTGSQPNLVTAGALAKHLNLPESWVRTEERLGQIPSVRLGKYVRFRLSDVERSLAQKPREGRKWPIYGAELPGRLNRALDAVDRILRVLPPFDCETKHRSDDPEDPVDRPMRIFLFAQLVSKFFHDGVLSPKEIQTLLQEAKPGFERTLFETAHLTGARQSLI